MTALHVPFGTQPDPRQPDGEKAMQAAICQAMLDAFPMADKIADNYAAVAVKAGEAAAFEYSQSGGGPIGVFLSGLIAYQNALASTPKATS